MSKQEEIITKPSTWPEWVDFTERDWPDTGDNGCYMHRCLQCGNTFHGHKRRAPVCRKCDDC